MVAARRLLRARHAKAILSGVGATKRAAPKSNYDVRALLHNQTVDKRSRCLFSACHEKGRNVGTSLLLYYRSILVLGLSAMWLGGCTSLSPLRPNTAANPNNSVIAKNGYKIAFIEFGEQGSYQDPTQLKNALDLI